MLKCKVGNQTIQKIINVTIYVTLLQHVNYISKHSCKMNITNTSFRKKKFINSLGDVNTLYLQWTTL